MYPESATPSSQITPVKLMEQLRGRIRVKHYSIRTEQAYVDWVRRFILFHGGASMATQQLLNLIGNTPLVEVTRMEAGNCRLFLKLESQNPGGSIKDRIGRSMIEAAERDGQLKPGGTIIEATAGNTGLGLAHETTTGPEIRGVIKLHTENGTFVMFSHVNQWQTPKAPSTPQSQP